MHVVTMLSYANSMLNPLLYAAFNENLRVMPGCCRPLLSRRTVAVDFRPRFCCSARSRLRTDLLHWVRFGIRLSVLCSDNRIPRSILLISSAALCKVPPCLSWSRRPSSTAARWTPYVSSLSTQRFASVFVPLPTPKPLLYAAFNENLRVGFARACRCLAGAGAGGSMTAAARSGVGAPMMPSTATDHGRSRPPRRNHKPAAGHRLEVVEVVAVSSRTAATTDDVLETVGDVKADECHVAVVAGTSAAVIDCSPVNTTDRSVDETLV